MFRYGFIIPDANPDFSTDGRGANCRVIDSVCPPDCYQIEWIQIPEGGRKGGKMHGSVICR